MCALQRACGRGGERQRHRVSVGRYDETECHDVSVGRFCKALGGLCSSCYLDGDRCQRKIGRGGPKVEKNAHSKKDAPHRRGDEKNHWEHAEGTQLGLGALRSSNGLLIARCRARASVRWLVSRFQFVRSANIEKESQVRLAVGRMARPEGFPTLRLEE